VAHDAIVELTVKRGLEKLDAIAQLVHSHVKVQALWYFPHANGARKHDTNAMVQLRCAQEQGTSQ
jgi:hypothetical protein